MIGPDRASRFNFVSGCVWQMKLKELACATGFHFYFGSERMTGRSETRRFNGQGFKHARAYLKLAPSVDFHLEPDRVIRPAHCHFES